MKVSVIIPTYNEAKTIKKIIIRVKQQRFKGATKEIIVVNDGSTDATKRILRLLSGLTVINLGKNHGKGAAVRRGVQAATGDYVLIQDADLEYDPADINALIEPVLTKKALVVYGSRFLGPHRNMLFWHMVGNKFLSLMADLLYNTTLSDMEVGYKLIPRPLMLALNLQEPRFGFDPEVTSKILKRDIRIYEVPVSYSGREFAEGKKITWVDGIRAFILMLKYRFFA